MPSKQLAQPFWKDRQNTSQGMKSAIAAKKQNWRAFSFLRKEKIVRSMLKIRSTKDSAAGRHMVMFREETGVIRLYATRQLAAVRHMPIIERI
jgi:hypothetical protein